MSWSDIVDLNGLEEPFLLRIGQRLMLPPVSATSAQGLEERAAAFTLDIDDILTGGEPATDNVGAVPNPAIPRLNSETIENAVNMPDRFIGGFTWPASGQVARGFGKVGLGQFNQGIDLAVLQQSPISASGAGIVAFVGNNVANYGGLILIRHGEGWITAYGRITNPSVAKGQSVKQGQQIARAGNGGAPLLFFQIRKNMSPIDPISRLPQR